MSLGTGVVCDLQANRYIRNVIGSTKDPLLSTRGNEAGWIGLWKEKTNWNDSHGKVKCCICGQKDGWEDEWGNPHRMIGGHIVLGSQEDMQYGAESMHEGDLEGGNRVFIAPICSRCNAQSGNLWVKEPNKIVQLCGFFYDADGETQVLCQMWDNGEEAEDDELFWRKVIEYRENVKKIVEEQSGLVDWDCNYLSTSAASPPSTVSVVSTQSAASNPGSSHTGARQRRCIDSDKRYDYSSSAYYYY